ncbi:MAG TPA: ABC transporter permease, partial [Solirubrobacteraceae bacterium]
MIGAGTLRIAWSGITANKLRSSLTILGMTIGVASVIVLIAVGNGSSQAVQSQIQSLGTNVLIIMPSGGGFRLGPRAVSAANSVSLTKQDAQALENPGLAPDVKSASPVVNATSVTLVYGSSSYEPSSFVGTTPSYLSAHSYRIAEGAAFSTADVAQHKRVAVIGQTVLEELFPGQSPIGQSIKVNGSNF